MFDVSFWELCLVGVVALLVLGPEKLPRASRTAGLWIGKVRRTLAQMQAEIERELDLDEIKRLNDRIDPALERDSDPSTRSRGEGPIQSSESEPGDHLTPSQPDRNVASPTKR